MDDKWVWFDAAKYGLFIHWGPYARQGRGEQVLMREMRDQQAYARAACAWNPQSFDARQWAKIAVDGGFRYAVLTTRHHDGYCLWKTAATDYNSAAQAPKRDFVAEYVEAFRAAGLRVGLYYSLADFRIPAYFAGPQGDPQGWQRFRAALHQQVRELMTGYGPIDMMWFDGAWPHDAEAWGSRELVTMMRSINPQVLINNRLGAAKPGSEGSHADGGAGAGELVELGDFGTPEHHITADPARRWESCQVSTWRLWGYTDGERWRPAALLLDMLCEAAEKGGNLLLNVGPDAEGRIPQPFVERSAAIGRWLAVHGEAIHGVGAGIGSTVETVTWGRTTRRDQTVHAIVRFWPHDGELYLRGLATPVTQARLIGTDAVLTVERYQHGQVVTGLPIQPPTDLFPVIKLVLAGPPRKLDSFEPGQWCGDPQRFLPWAMARGTGTNTDGSWPH